MTFSLSMMVFVLASGCQDYSYTEVEFNQTYQQDLVSTYSDIFFVVDNSASMAEEQELLTANFQAFVDVVEDSYADFQAGVITTDVSTEDAGIIHGEVITPDTENMSEAFLEALDVGSYGSRDEEGLEAIALALTDNRNPGFIRDGANLNVVIVSDEDDHSPDDIVNYLQTMQENSGSGTVVVHAIVGNLPDGCASGVSAADPGVRYLEIAELTGGYQDSICAEDYSEILAQIGLDLSGLNDTFYLDDLPQPDSIQVLVEGVEIPNREINGWVYSGAKNAIVFDGYAVPRPGMSVVVYYEVLLTTDMQDTGL